MSTFVGKIVTATPLKGVFPAADFICIADQELPDPLLTLIPVAAPWRRVMTACDVEHNFWHLEGEREDWRQVKHTRNILQERLKMLLHLGLCHTATAHRAADNIHALSRVLALQPERRCWRLGA